VIVTDLPGGWYDKFNNLASWISVGANPSAYYGDYTYETTFDLPNHSDKCFAAITLNIAADDEVVSISVNGQVAAYVYGYGYNQFESITVVGPVQAIRNIFAVQVYNAIQYYYFTDILNTPTVSFCNRL
jgi:hypothetical protein